MVSSSYFSIGCARSKRPGIVAYGIPLNEWTVVPSVVVLDVPVKVVWSVLWWTFETVMFTEKDSGSHRIMMSVFFCPAPSFSHPNRRL